MKTKWTLLLLIIILFVIQSKAAPIAGGEITYEFVSKNKYNIYFKYYRDCRGTSENSTTFNFGLSCPSSSLDKKLSPTLVSIKQLPTLCGSVQTKCDPPNTMISSAYPIFEEHTLKYTVDFDNAESAFANCCNLKLYMNRCCRDSKLNTGPQGTDFYITSDLNICGSLNNSSPKFVSFPPMVINLNQPFNYAVGAMDTVDFDSLSYALVDPLKSLKDPVSWSGGFDKNNPLQVYWPAGYDKSKGPLPTSAPPIGFYMNNLSGDIVFTPTDSNQTVLCIVVKEWRKIAGAYTQIGEVRREFNLIIRAQTLNNPPILNGPYKYEVCAGQQICFTITSDDKQFIPPPPAKANAPDTVNITWNRAIPGASFTIQNPKARLQSGKFCWTPKEKDASDLPYTFTVTARDNSCPVNAVTVKSYSVLVKQIAKTQIIKNISNNIVSIKSNLDPNFKGTPSFKWDLKDSVFNPLDTNYFFFTSNKKHSSTSASDSLLFSKTGHFVLYHQVNNSPLNCPRIYYDTIRISVIKKLETRNLNRDFVRIFPNPANQHLKVMQTQPADHSSFELVNILGEVLMVGNLNESETEINLNALNQGLYFIRIKNEKTTMSFQFVKIQ